MFKKLRKNLEDASDTLFNAERQVENEFERIRNRD
jgi:hypothetical protein